MIYSAGNLIDSGTVIVPSTEDTTYASANLFNQRPGKPFRFTTTAGNIVFDLGTAQAVTFCGIMGHNIDSGATITLEGNASDSWGAPSKSEVISHADTNMYKTFASGSYRYWRLVVSGAAATVKIGELVLNTYVTLSDTYEWKRGDTTAYNSVTSITEYGQPWKYYKYKQKKFKLSFVASDTTRTEMDTLFEAVNGSTTPFCFISYDSELKYVNLPGSESFSLDFTNINKISFVLTEVPQGKTI